MSSAVNGDVAGWWINLDAEMTDTDSNGNATSEGLQWFNEYIGKYMNIAKIEKSHYNTPIFFLPDGAAFAFLNQKTTRDWVYYTNYYKCKKLFGDYNSKNQEMMGKCAFPFLWANDYSGNNKGFEPWLYQWDKTEEGLYSGCEENGFFCTALIQRNGWKIPQDYPRKVVY